MWGHNEKAYMDTIFASWLRTLKLDKYEARDVYAEFKDNTVFDYCISLANADDYDEYVELGFSRERKERGREVLMGKIQKDRNKLLKMAWYSKASHVFEQHGLPYTKINTTDEDEGTMLSAVELEIAVTDNPWILVHSLCDVVDHDVLWSLMRKLQRVCNKTCPSGERYAAVYLLLQKNVGKPNETVYDEAVQKEFTQIRKLEPDLDFLDMDPSFGRMQRHPLYNEHFTDVKQYYAEHRLDAAARYCESQETANMPSVEYSTFRKLLNQICVTDDVNGPGAFRLVSRLCAEEMIAQRLKQN